MYVLLYTISRKKIINDYILWIDLIDILLCYDILYVYRLK